MSSWISWLILGGLSLAAGLFALLNPVAATFTAELMTGYLFIGIGALMLLSIFVDDRRASRLLSLVMGIVLLAIGVSLVGNPLQGVLSLTVVVAILMLVVGVVRIMLASQMPTAGLKAIMVLAGFVSLGLGAMILTNFPESAAVVLGILLAIELLSNGVALILLALAARQQAS